MLGALPRQASGDPAMVSGFRMASILSRKYHGHLARFVQRAGLLLDVLVWGAIPSGNLSRCLRITPQGHDSFCLMPFARHRFRWTGRSRHTNRWCKNARQTARAYFI